MSGIMSMLLGAVSSAAAAVDEFFNRVTLLLPGNGTNGAQNNTFLDSSTNNFTITRNGNTTQGTFSPFSQTGWSNFFDGTGDYLTFATGQTPLFLGNSDFTFETWVYRASGTGTATIFAGQADLNTAAGSSYVFYVSSTATSDVYIGSSSFSITSPNPTVGQWSHVAWVRTGGTYSSYLNGSRVGTRTDLSTSSVNNGATNFPPAIGGIGNGTSLLNGYISNARLIKGSGGYDATQSTITVPTSPLTAITNTSLLTCQSNRFIDNSTNAFAITRNGDVSVQAFSPFAPTAAYSASTVGGSGYFDGTGDYLTTPSNAAFDFWGGSFTFECWFYPTGGLSNSVIFSTGSSTTGVNLGFSSNTQVYSNQSGGLTLISGTAPTLNAWNHIALSKSGSTFALFLNGARLGTSTSTAYPTGNQVAYIGANSANNSQVITGYVSNARLVKGSAVYDPTQTTLTVPTAPLTAITNTSLLLNYTNAGITDATAKNVLETVANTQISTTQSKFGGSSISFPGSSYAVMPYTPQVNLGLGGDITVEFWGYWNSLTASPQAVVGQSSSSADGRTFIYTYSDGRIAIGINGTNEIVASAGTITTGSWIYIAIVRSGSTTTIYKNGSSVASNTTAVWASSTNPLYVGGAASITSSNMYIDDLRITRYARTITTPTTAFPLQ